MAPRTAAKNPAAGFALGDAAPEKIDGLVIVAAVTTGTVFSVVREPEVMVITWKVVLWKVALPAEVIVALPVEVIVAFEVVTLGCTVVTLG